MVKIEYNPDLTKDVRSKLNLTQNELSDLVGVSMYCVQRWEYGKSNPRANHLGIIYDIAAQNELNSLPVWKKDGELVVLPIIRNYQGEYTLPVKKE